MGPPVASLLIFLHSSPFCCMLVSHSRSPRSLRTSQTALPFLAILCLLVVPRCLATYHTHVWLTSLVILAPYWPFHCWSSSLEPWPALWWAGLLLLSSGSQRFRLYCRVGNASGVRFTLTIIVGCLHPLLFALFLPNSITKLLNAVQVRVVQERQEVSVPQPVLGRVTCPTSYTGKSRKDVSQFLCRDDLEVEAQQRLDKAMFHSLAVVNPCVSLV